MVKNETPYIETEILLAVLNDDKERAENLYATLSVVERGKVTQAFNIARWIGLELNTRLKLRERREENPLSLHSDEVRVDNPEQKA